MKLPLSLIKSFIQTDLSASKLAETLYTLGIEVDAIYNPQPVFSGVVVAEVIRVEKHPEAEKLQIAQVFDGKQTVQVVCGAPNCRAGLRVAFAPIGAEFSGEKPLKIEKTTLRGVESNGMLCSAGELNMHADQSGEIIELPLDMPIGADCIDLLWDPVLEISLTPNLGHCMSAIGIARELSASLQVPLQSDKTTVQEHSSSRTITANVQDYTLCPRYCGRIIENVSVKPSPFWLQQQLLAAGLNPINNIVDATNYILLKFGQPLHAFDLDTLEGGSVEVSPATQPLSFIALNGTTLEIPSGTLLISDAKKPVAIAGIVGGAHSAVSEKTRHILLEAASFDPIAIRLSSKKLALRTDSSLRFEKGVDPSSVPHLLDIAANLIAELSGGAISANRIDCKKTDFLPRQIDCRPMRVNKILGTKLSENEIHEIFRRLGFGVKQNLIEVPLYRTDITAEIDLIEEVARIYGYNNIERPLPLITTPQIPHDPEYLFEVELRRRFIGLGLQEFLTCDLISPKQISALSEFSALQKGFLKTLHSKSEEYSILRPSLLPGLLQTVRSNIDQKNHHLAVFEMGRIHFIEEGKPVEFPMAAILLTGNNTPVHWDLKAVEFDFFDLKGFVENLLEGLRIPSSSFSPGCHATFHPGRQADILVGETRLGSLGEIHPDLLAKFDIKQKVYYAELNAHHLRALQAPPPKMKPLPLFPASERDWTLPIPLKTPISTIVEAITAVQPELLEQFSLTDIYTAESTVNATFRFVYRDRHKTVSSEEVEAAHTKLKEEVLAKTMEHR